MDLLKDWVEIAQSVSIILAAWTALYSIDAWRREFIGKRRMELAEDVLALFYQSRDVIEQMRNPVGFAGEGQTRRPGENEDPAHKAKLDAAYVLVERYQRHTEMFSRISALRYRFQTLFGHASAKPFDDLTQIVNELLVAARQRVRYDTNPRDNFRSQEESEKYYDRLEQIDSVYYASYDNNDPIRPRVNAIVDAMEKTCRGVIESRGTLFAAINAKIRESS